MDDVVVRPRYRRNYNAYSSRRRKNIRYGNGNTMAETIIKQTVISLIILIVVGLMKSLDTAPTNYITNKIKSTLTHHTEVKSIYQGIDRIVQKTGKLFPGLKNSEEKTGEGEIDEENFDAAKGENMDQSTTDNISGGQSDQVLESLADESMISAIKVKYTFSLPVDGFLSSPYGYRTSPITQETSFHHGVDIGAASGATIKAALDGEVIEADSDRVYGNYIKIRHEDGLETLYAHCSELIAQRGNKVSRGTTIARVGNTGLSVGTHLHFEIRKDGKTLDPAKIIEIPLAEN